MESSLGATMRPTAGLEPIGRLKITVLTSWEGPDGDAIHTPPPPLPPNNGRWSSSKRQFQRYEISLLGSQKVFEVVTWWLHTAMMIDCGGRHNDGTANREQKSCREKMTDGLRAQLVLFLYNTPCTYLLLEGLATMPDYYRINGTISINYI